MRCALVNESTWIVENMIVADPAVDPAPAGYIIIGVADDSPVQIGWSYDQANNQFFDPNPLQE